VWSYSLRIDIVVAGRAALRGGADAYGACGVCPLTLEVVVVKTLKISGMSCQHCANAVTKVLGAIDGVSNVKIDLSKGEASFDEKGPVDMEAVRAGVKKAGYEVVG
jgi:copper chaperone